MPTIPVRVHRVTIVGPTSPPAQVQRVPLKSSEGVTIPARTSIPPRPVRPSLNTLKHDLRPRNTRAAVVPQLVIQDHLNHLYNPVTVQRETYEKLKLQHPKRWITSMSNELGCLASVVGDRIASRTYIKKLSTRIKSQQ